MQKRLRTRGGEGPHNGPLVAVFTANGKKRQNFWAMAILKPLPGHLAVWHGGLNAAGQRMLRIVFHIEMHIKLGACLAGATFTNDG